MKFKFILAALALSGPVMAQSSSLVQALIRVESGGRANAIGDQGRALGILQIHSGMVQEANRIAGTRYVHRDMLDPVKARKVASIVLGHYARHIKQTTGRPATRKELAFIWNGGGEAWKRASRPVADAKQANLQRYWSRVAASF